MLPKAIQELFTSDYGRMNATLGVELPFSTMTNQTTIPYGYIDPATEVIKVTDSATLIGAAGDGTQIWKITHNGVDTHAIHVHMFNAQLINRVGWDGAVKPPDANEVGWKDTLKMNPLEDIIIAVRPTTITLPFDLPNSVRALDPTQPLGTATQFTGVDTNGNPVTVANQLVNFGWEYVWHCHLLGHEENDMMRPMMIAVPPVAPSNLALSQAVGAGNPVVVTWRDNSLNETSFTVQRATAAGGPWTTLSSTVPAVTGTGSTVTYNDSTVTAGNTYYYKVMATNSVGGVTGYPGITVNSTATAALSITTH